MTAVWSITQRVPVVYAWLLGALLIGYAIGGRGFAHHTGVYPVYMGEVALLFGVIIVLLGIWSMRPHFASILLISFLAYSAVHTSFFLGTHGFEAARDAVIWVYGIIALAIAVSLRQEHASRVVDLYRWSVPVFLIWTPVASILRRNYHEQLPGLATTNVPVIYFISGDFAVHLAGVAAFIIFGFMTWRGRNLGLPGMMGLWTLWAVAAYFTFNSRGAVLTLLICLVAAQALYLVGGEVSHPLRIARIALDAGDRSTCSPTFGRYGIRNSVNRRNRQFQLRHTQHYQHVRRWVSERA
jgi:hypothetical protein